MFRMGNNEYISIEEGKRNIYKESELQAYIYKEKFKPEEVLYLGKLQSMEFLS